MSQGGTVQEAFSHWKAIYNLSLVVQHTVFAITALHFLRWELDSWTLFRSACCQFSFFP